MSVALTIDVRDVDWKRLKKQLAQASEDQEFWDEYYRDILEPDDYGFDQLIQVASLALDQAGQAGLLEEDEDETDDD